MPDPNRTILSKIKTIKKEVGGEEIDRAESSEIMRSLTPFEKDAGLTVEAKQPQISRVFNEKEKLNDPIAISKGPRRTIRHETLERDDDLHYN